MKQSLPGMTLTLSYMFITQHQFERRWFPRICIEHGSKRLCFLASASPHPQQPTYSLILLSLVLSLSMSAISPPPPSSLAASPTLARLAASPAWESPPSPPQCLNLFEYWGSMETRLVRTGGSPRVMIYTRG
eukprot:768087-Hanusia_phi.AAC.7